MSRLHPSLSKDYTFPEGRLQSCGLVAINIARILLNEGRKPYILRIEGKADATGNRETITPKRLRGITWGCHQVCCVGDLVYDPMQDARPMTLEKYLRTTFREELETSILYSQTQTEELVQRTEEPPQS